MTTLSRLSTGEKVTLIGYVLAALITGFVFWSLTARIASALVSMVDLLTESVALASTLIRFRRRATWLLLRSLVAPLFGLPREFRPR